MAETYSAGIVTAYGAAVRGGYTGTYEQFCAEQAQFGANAAKVAQDRAAVEAATQTFTTVTVPGAVQAVQQTGATQVQAVEAASETEQQQIALAGAAQETRVTQAGDDQVDAVEEAGATHVGNVNTAGTTQVGNVNTAGTTQVGAVNTAGATQVQAVEDKGQEVIDSIPDDYTELTEDVADLKNAITQIEENIENGVSDKSGGLEVPILDNPFGLKLYDTGNGTYRVNKRYADFYKEAEIDSIQWTDIYLNPETGNNNNSGTSADAPVKTLAGAIGKTGDNIRVILPSGNFTAFNSGITGTVTDSGKNIMIVCPDGIYKQRWGVLASSRSWTDATSGTWSNSLSSSPTIVLDGTDYYTKVNTLEDCQATASTFYHGSGTLYIHTSDGTKPSTQFLAFAYPATTINLQTGKNIIIKNVELLDPLFSYGNAYLSLSGTSSITQVKNFIENVRCNRLSVSNYATNFIKNLEVNGLPGNAQDGVNITNPNKTWFERCVVKNCGADGFNYHNSGSSGNPFAVELECEVANCGVELTATINNCSTLHENCQIIRIGGSYYISRDRVIHDIGTSKSYNCFCNIRQLERDGNTTMDFSVGNSSGDTVEMYIYNCDVSGSNATYNVGVFSGSNNIIKSFGTRFDRLQENEDIITNWNPWAS